MRQNNNCPFDEFYYREVYKNYPSEITLDQMRIICKIAKRTAKYLLDQGIVPCENTGKKTRQYTILRDDVIAYLQIREDWGTQSPHIPNHMKQKKRMDSFSLHIRPGMEKEISNYFEDLFKEYPDVLYVSDAIYLTGMSKESIRRRIKANQIEAVYYRKKFHIPKQALLDFVQSPSYLSAFFTSERFCQIIGGFLLCQQEK